jgi:hypothetical protein
MEQKKTGSATGKVSKKEAMNSLKVIYLENRNDKITENLTVKDFVKNLNKNKK